MTKGGHLTLIAGLLAGLGIFALPLTAMAQVYPGQASYFQNMNGFNGFTNPGRHLGWEHRRWERERMGNGGCGGGLYQQSANPLAYQQQYGNPSGINPYSSYSPLAGNNIFGNGILGNTFQPLNNSSFLSLTPSQERSYMKTLARRVDRPEFG